MQVDAGKLQAAVSVGETLREQARAREAALQAELSALSATAGTCAELREQLDSATWQLAQERELKAERVTALEQAGAQLAAALADAESARARLADAQREAAAAGEREAAAALALRAARLEAETSTRSVGELRDDVVRSEAHAAALTARLSDSVSALQQARELLRKAGAREEELRRRAAEAEAAAAAAATRAAAADATLQAERAAAPEKDELLREFAEQVRSALMRRFSTAYFSGAPPCARGCRCGGSRARARRSRPWWSHCRARSRTPAERARRPRRASRSVSGRLTASSRAHASPRTGSRRVICRRWRRWRRRFRRRRCSLRTWRFSWVRPGASAGVCSVALSPAHGCLWMRVLLSRCAHSCPCDGLLLTQKRWITWGID